jgi:hypothetical protein
MRRAFTFVVILAATALLVAGIAASSSPGARAAGTMPADPTGSFADAGSVHTTTGPTPPSNVVLPPSGARAAALTATGDHLLNDVPSYLWHDGCAPTSVGMIVGYYDGHGYDALIPGDATSETTAVSQAIASHEDSPGHPRHYEDYALPKDDSLATALPDRSEAPAGDEHASDSIADFMETSWSSVGLTYGSSYVNEVGPAFVDYVAHQLPSVSATYHDYLWSGTGSTLWNVLTTEINAGRPVVLLVDSSGDGRIDHAVAGIGYRGTLSSSPEYACWDTWTNTVRWEPFQAMSASYDFGVYGATTFALSGGSSPSPSASPSPSPSASPTDTTPPVTTVRGVDGSWHHSPVPLSFTAFDSGSSVLRTESRLSSSAPWVTGTERLVWGQGVHTVQFRSVDVFENTEPTRLCTVKIDAYGPVTTARSASVVRGNRVSLRYLVTDLTPRATVRLVVRDAHGKSRKTIMLGLRWSGKAGAYTFHCFLGRGRYHYCVYATDQAGNAARKLGTAPLVVR